jgi:hypothetical protein
VDLLRGKKEKKRRKNDGYYVRFNLLPAVDISPHLNVSGYFGRASDIPLLIHVCVENFKS